MEDSALARVEAQLAVLYDGPARDRARAGVLACLRRFAATHPEVRGSSHDPALDSPPRSQLGLDQGDALVIAYGDSFRAEGEAPLRTLRRALDEVLGGAINGVHLLPHYPYSSDDGFSVVDYRAVDPALGTWADVEALAAGRPCMFDAVINHASAESVWFTKFLAGEAPYDRFFIALDPDTDVSGVYRPREHALLTEFASPRGPLHLWTTFSDDQVDLNLAEPDVLVALVDLLLDYVAKGATLLRLDAIGLLAKRLGTTCLHLPETHAFVKLLRAVLDHVAPAVLLVPEINGPYEENAPYFGTGDDEAQLVYNFTLPPLVMHSLRVGEAETLARWLSEVRFPGPRTTFFNFLASHDGIGVRPVEPLLSTQDMAALVRQAESHGGRVNYRTGEDGTRRPYELCLTYYDALNGPDVSVERGVARMRVAHAMMLAMRGVPGIYVHSLFGSPSWQAGLAETKHNRTLNRERLSLSAVASALADPESRAARIWAALRELLEARSSHPAFHPAAPQGVSSPEAGVLAIERGVGERRVICLHNVTDADVTVTLDRAPRHALVGDGLEGEQVTLAPYAVSWLAL